MNKIIIFGLAAVAAGFGLSSLGSIPARADAPIQATIRVADYDNYHHFDYERHPELRAARQSLLDARTNLQNAAHDYHGHRDQAIAAINDALAQIDMAFQSDHH